MTVYAYLRVSSVQQDEQNQRQGVDKKAEELGITIDKYVIDKVSGTKDPNKRNLGKLLRKCKEGDYILISELSRLGRNLFMVFKIAEELLNKKVNVYSVKDNIHLDGSLQATVMVFAFGLAAQIEKELLSSRTRESLQRLKAQGVKLGRPKGFKLTTSKLDKYQNKIKKQLEQGKSKSFLARKYKVCLKTMRKYIKDHDLMPKNNV